MRLGKFSKADLESLVLNKAIVDDSVILGPKYGEDGAILKVSSKYIIAVSDPITGASRLAGWLAVQVNANDVAVHLAKPKWFLSVLLFPPDINKHKIETVVEGMKEACKEIGCSIVGGHTEITDRVVDTIIGGFMIGEPIFPGKFITSGGAKPLDKIIVTKGAGIEGTFILCSDFGEYFKGRLSSEFLENCLKLKNKISILPEINIISSNPDIITHIHAMHDATEGGILGAIYEMAIASSIGFRVYEDKVPILAETKKILSIVDFDPLRLISSGSLVLAVEANYADRIVKLFESHDIPASIVGEFLESSCRRVVINKNGTKVLINEAPEDELWRLIKNIKRIFKDNN